MTSPANDASFAAPATIDLTATVTANGHTVSMVDFFAGAALVGSDATAPYSFAWTGVAPTFDDLAAAKLGTSSVIRSGTWKPSDYDIGDPFPSPAPGGTHGATLSAFSGVNPNGTWSLYVVDDEAGDSGSLSSGWTLHFAY